MSAAESFLAGNAEFARDFTDGDLPIPPRSGTLIVGCVDARVNPTNVFAMRPGDAFVIRNVGGRVTDDVISQLRMLGTLSESVGGKAPSVIVLHHTNCGTARFSDPELADAVAAASGKTREDVQALVITDPAASAREDAAKLRTALGDGPSIDAMVYDVTTGVVRQV